MKYKKCTKPPQHCGRMFNETEEEFEEGFCICGATLIIFNPIERENKEEQAGLECQENQGVQEDEEINDQQKYLEDEEKQDHQGDQEDKEDTEIHKDDIETEVSDEQLENVKGPFYYITESGQLLFREDPNFIELQDKFIDLEDRYRDYTGDRVVLLYKKRVYKTIPLEFDEMIIGRESKGEYPDIDLTSIDSNRLVSRRHAMIYRGNQSYYLRNLSSKSTLTVNQEYLLENQEVELSNESKIVLSSKFGLIFYQENGEVDD